MAGELFSFQSLAEPQMTGQVKQKAFFNTSDTFGLFLGSTGNVDETKPRVCCLSGRGSGWVVPLSSAQWFWVGS